MIYFPDFLKKKEKHSSKSTKMDTRQLVEYDVGISPEDTNKYFLIETFTGYEPHIIIFGDLQTIDKYQTKNTDHQDLTKNDNRKLIVVKCEANANYFGICHNKNTGYVFYYTNDKHKLKKWFVSKVGNDDDQCTFYNIAEQQRIYYFFKSEFNEEKVNQIFEKSD